MVELDIGFILGFTGYSAEGKEEKRHSGLLALIKVKVQKHSKYGWKDSSVVKVLATQT